MNIFTFSKNQKFHTFIIIVSFLFISSYSLAQNIQGIKFEHLSTENIKLEKGLSQNSVRCIFQDQKGVIWFGTWDGLNKYDGINYTIYKPNYLDQANGVSDQTINAICEDLEGNLWIGTDNGLNKYNRRNRKFTQYFHNPNDPKSISNDSIHTLKIDNNGAIWIGTQNGLNKYVRSSDSFITFKSKMLNKVASRNNILDLTIDKAGNFWVATAHGLNKFNVVKNELNCYCTANTCKNCVNDDIIWCVEEDAKNNLLYVGTDNGLNVIDLNTGLIKSYKNNHLDSNSLSNNHIYSIKVGRKGDVWIGTMGGGLNIFDPDSNIFYKYTNNPLNDQSLSNDYIYDIFEDKSGIIWIGTAWKGINKVDRNIEIFKHYHQNSTRFQLNNKLVRFFNEDDEGRLWVATQKGVNFFDIKTGKPKPIEGLPEESTAIFNLNIKGIVKDYNGNFWLWTDDNQGIYKYYTKTKKFTHLKHEDDKPNTIVSNSVKTIFEDSEHNIWIGTAFGLNKLNTKTGKLELFNHSSDSGSISHNIVYRIYEDHDNNIWVGTHNGLNLFNKQTGKFKIFKHQLNNNKSLSFNKIFAIHEDKSGRLWIGTAGGGLNLLNRQTNEFTYYTEIDGLADNFIYDILEDKNGNLWLSSNNGISKFNADDQRFINYNIQDGIQSNEFNLYAAFISKTGQMYFGGMNGYNSFYPSTIEKNMIVPEIIISSFKVLNKLVTDEIQNGDTINLSHNDNFFSIEFAALEYSNPAKSNYQYKLTGINENWVSTTADRAIAEYTQLRPGTYTFNVKGSNNNGIWNEEGAKITIIIHPPWYNTLLFRILSLVFIISIIWFLITQRIKNIRKKHNIEKQLIELERQSLRLQMNPHFIFNSLNSIQSFVVGKDTDKAIHYLAKFSKLMRLILSNSREAFVCLQDELQTLENYMDIEKLRFDDKFDYEITIDPSIDLEFIAIPPMLIQPYIENAILHGILHKKTRGKIYIHFKLLDNTIFVSIEDNGVGRELAQKKKAESGMKHKSKGMLITKERLEILSEQSKEQLSVNIIDLKDSDNKPIGTRVEITTIFVDI
ncbi:MAG: histidine kinase [Saprospiraceae bacterium]|nr:histidine kinase [Saprospiraceae bacterium]